jgi:tetratricopeptide (TPR) repeat protein
LVSAFSLLALALCLQAPGQSRLRVIGPQPAVVVFPQTSQLVLRIEVDDAAQMRQLSEPALPSVAGLRLALGQPNSSQQSFFDGRRMTQSFTVQWPVQITPLRVGDFTIPAFTVPVGNGSETTRPLTLRVVKDIEGDQFGYFTMRVEPLRAYVHEPVRVRLDLGVVQDLEVVENQASNGERYLGIEISAPWLAELDGAVPIESPAPDRRRTMNLVYNDGRSRSLLRAEFVDDANHAGRRANGFVVERSFLPSRAGKLVFPATAMGFDAFTGEVRDVQDFVFSRRERVTKTFYVYAPAVEVEVLPLPEQGRPSPFYGAVGRFTLSARTDKTRVKVGSSVKLIVEIRGEGNLEFLAVPELGNDLVGFHLLGHKEKRERGLVEVTYDLTPLKADVKHTPAVAWNYFDTTPGVERYVSVQTDPVPLTVEALPEGEGLKALPGEESKVVVPGVDDIFDMKPLGEDAPALAPAPMPRAVLLALLLAPWLLALVLAAALRARARTRADVAGQRERGARRAFARVLEGGGAPFDALVRYLADRLDVAEAAVIAPDLRERLLKRGVDEDLAARLVAAVEAGVAARYGGGGGVTREAARDLVDACERVRFRAVRATPVVVCLLAALSVGAPGQDAAARGEAAYRAGDYATAVREFTSAAASAPLDRRVFYNLGNAWYRQGDLGRALAAYEKARLGLPRDPQLAANIALVRGKLELGSAEGEPFLHALGALRDAMTAREQRVLCVLLHVLAAALLVLGWRRGVLRVLGFLVLAPASLLAVELLVLAPARPDRGIIVVPRAEVTAEPRAGLEAVVKLRRGAAVEVLGEGPSWTKVRAGAREGYVPSDSVDVVR